MIKSELITLVGRQNPHLTTQEAEGVVRAVLDRVAAALADGDRVELRDFGTFSTRDRGARMGRNPRTGEEVMVRAKGTIHFKAGRAMQARLNRERLEPKVGMRGPLYAS